MRQQFYPDVNFGSPDLSSEAGRAAVVTPLLNTLIVNDGLSTQPDADSMSAELNSLISEMSGASETTIITAVCTAALGGATMLLQ